MTTEAQPDAQLAWERRFGRLVAAAAFAAAVCVVVYQALVQAVVIDSRPRVKAFPELLLGVDRHPTAFVIASAVQVVGNLLLGVVLWYLFRATRYRRPELQSQFIGLAYLGPASFALGSALSAAGRIDLADKFSAGAPIVGKAGQDRAEDLAGDVSIVGPVVTQVGLLAIAILLVLVCMNAMRVGLLNRFQGIIGIVVGALFILPLFPGAPLILQTFWLGAIGAIMLNRWPGGRGPAWDTGEAIPWPTAADRRALAEGEQRPAAVEEEAPVRRRSRKRKRKR